jgi:hypothetical protein
MPKEGRFWNTNDLLRVGFPSGRVLRIIAPVESHFPEPCRTEFRTCPAKVQDAA